VRSIAAVNHANVCHLYDVGANYLVMEYVEGAPLKGPLPPQEALAEALQIASALHAGHTQGIVHRDLKSARETTHLSVALFGSICVMLGPKGSPPVRFRMV
jgi:serine/threonine protein kinase